MRRIECEEACIELGVTTLRELTIADEPRVERLPEPHRRRVRHVMTENARVRSAATALRTGNLVRLSALLYASHDLLRDDYEVSVPELDYLVAAAQAERDIVGARMTGGGFGGCALIVTMAGAAERVGEIVADHYAARFPPYPPRHPAIVGWLTADRLLADLVEPATNRLLATSSADPLRSTPSGRDC